MSRAPGAFAARGFFSGNRVRGAARCATGRSRHVDFRIALDPSK